MDISRRNFFSLSGVGFLAAYSGNIRPLLGDPTGQPFDDGDNGHYHGPVPEGWDSFKARFLTADGRVVDNGNGGISHSEGQGYGMLLAAHARDREAFDLLYRWAQENLYNPQTGFFAWKYDPALSQPVPDPNNASDGDILIAWALGIGAEYWQQDDLRQASEDLRQNIRSRLFVKTAGRELLLPGLHGFRAGASITLNPSYYIWPAFDFFHSQAPGEGWDRLARDGSDFLFQARFGEWRLPTDWVDVSSSGSVTPALGREPRFGFDAVRIPLYSFLGGRTYLTQSISNFWASHVANGETPPAWVDVISDTHAPYAASEGVAAIAALVTGQSGPIEPLSTDYYSAVLQVLSSLGPDVLRS